MGQNRANWITLEEARNILGVARNTVKKLIREGILPAYQIEGVVGYKLKRADVESLIKLVVIKTTRKKGRVKR